MRRLSEKEEEIVGMLRSHGGVFVREVVERFDEPRPHFNTVATFVRGPGGQGLSAP